MFALKKIFIIFSLLTYLFSVSIFSAEAFVDDRSEGVENILNDIKVSCKDCEDLTFEKIGKLTLEELQMKCKDSGLLVDYIYDISKLKCGEKHVSTRDGNDYIEYFRLTAIDEILNFFKAPLNYEQKENRDNLNKTITKYSLIGGLVSGSFTYLYCSLLNWVDRKMEQKTIEKNKDLKGKNNKNNKPSISNKLKLLWSSVVGTVGLILGAYAGYDRWKIDGEKEQIKLIDYLKIKNTIKSIFKTEDWDGADILEFHISKRNPRSSRAYFYKVGIDYTEDEQNFIKKNFKTLFNKVEETINNTYVQSNNLGGK